MSTVDTTSERRVPVDDDWRERIEKKLDALVTALLGTLENPGGALKRIDDLDQRVKRLEGWRGWAVTLATSIATAVLGAVSVALVMKGIR